MIVVLKRNVVKATIDDIVQRVEAMGYVAHVIAGVERTVVGVVGEEKNKEQIESLVTLESVDKVMPVMQPYKLAARVTKPEDTVIKVGDVSIGGGSFVMIAGPCSVETEAQIMASAECVRSNGCHFLRGGAYKPRTSPYSFQGLEEDGLKLLAKAREKTGLSVVTELLSVHTAALVSEYTDIIQIGARNMQNFSLLKEVGKLDKPVLLKRGLSATLEELVMSAEYIMSEGNYNVILCERGIRTFEKAYRNTLDLNAIPALKKMTHLPVVVDPSHGTGRRDLIPIMSNAAIAAGADGLIVEIHPEPEKAFSDGPQSLRPEEFNSLVESCRPYVALTGKEWVTPVYA